MADLIVDFPRQRRRSSSSHGAREGPVVDEHEEPRRTTKRVHFASEYSLHCYERYAASDFEHIWHDADDYASFRSDVRQAAREAHTNVLKMQRHSDGLAAHAAGTDRMDDLDMTGIENQLSPGIIKKTRTSRMRCRRAVMDEQERQYDLGVRDAMQLAQVAREHASWSVRRAHTIGLLQSK